MATPLSQNNNLKRFNEAIGNVYGSPSIYGDQPGMNFGFRQPYVWVKQTDPNIIKYIKKFDSRAFPVGSTAQDVVRIGKLMVSGKGVAFLATQFLLQGQAAFNETSLYNPLEVMLATARPLSLGLIPRPKRFIDTSNLLSIIGLGGNDSPPPGTANTKTALSTFSQADSRTTKGLIRGRTAASGLKSFDKSWGIPSTDPKSNFLSTLVSTFAPGLMIPETNKNVKARADETSSDKMLEDYRKIDIVSRLQPMRARSDPAKYQSSVFKQKYDWTKTGQLSNTYENDVAPKTKQTNNDGGYLVGKELNDEALVTDHQFPEENGITEVNFNLKSALERVGGVSVPGVMGHIKTYTELRSISKDTQKGKSSGTADGSFEKSMGIFETLENRILKGGKGFAGYNKQDDINLAGVISGTPGGEKPTNRILETESDQIVFYFEDIVNNRFIPFRATVKSINDNIAPEWQDIRYMGRADKIFTYRGFSRELNFNFSVYANSIKEMEQMWTKINYLMGLGKPSGYTSSGTDVTSGFIVPPFVKIRIGDMYKNQPAILTGIGLSVPDDASWETTSGTGYEYLNGAIKVSGVKTGQYPTRVEVQVNMSLLEKSRPETNMYNFDDENDKNGFGLIVQ